MIFIFINLPDDNVDIFAVSLLLLYCSFSSIDPVTVGLSFLLLSGHIKYNQHFAYCTWNVFFDNFINKYHPYHSMKAFDYLQYFNFVHSCLLSNNWYFALYGYLDTNKFCQYSAVDLLD